MTESTIEILKESVLSTGALCIWVGIIIGICSYLIAVNR